MCCREALPLSIPCPLPPVPPGLTPLASLVLLAPQDWEPAEPAHEAFKSPAVKFWLPQLCVAQVQKQSPRRQSWLGLGFQLSWLWLPGFPSPLSTDTGSVLLSSSKALGWRGGLAAPPAIYLTAPLWSPPCPRCSDTALTLHRGHTTYLTAGIGTGLKGCWSWSHAGCSGKD